MDFIFIKSSKAGKEDYGSIYARVRTGKANMKVVTGFTIKQLEWEKYRSLQYTSSALMSSIGIKYGQFAQVLARIKAAFEADGFNPKEAKIIIESVRHLLYRRYGNRAAYQERSYRKSFACLYKRSAYHSRANPKLSKGNPP